MTHPEAIGVELLPCPFCGARPHHGLMKVEYCQLHGDPFQRFKVWCPHGCAEKIGANRELAITAWNRRAPSVNETPKTEHVEDDVLTAPAVDGLDFQHVSKTKLDGLLADGWQINGYSIQKDGRLGLVTTGAFVGWYSNAVDNGETDRAQVQRLTEENEALRKERDHCHTRLEIDRVWVMGDNDDSDLEPRDIPLDERGEIPDGIECRDATISVLEQDAIADKARIKALEKALEAIRSLGGNLSDEAIERVGGANDGRLRAIELVTARQIAARALSSTESQSK